MNVLEDLKRAVQNGRVTLEEANEALCEGIKRHYGAYGLNFLRGYEPGSVMDGYGDICLGGPPSPMGFGWGVIGDTWLCSTKETENVRGVPITRPDDLEMVLGDFYRGKLKVHFIDTGQTYDSLHDLRHDHLAMKLSGL